MTKTILATLVVLALVSACETMEGLGRDTQKLGGNISKAAERNNVSKQNNSNDPNSNNYQNSYQPIQQNSNY